MECVNVSFTRSVLILSALCLRDEEAGLEEKNHDRMLPGLLPSVQNEIRSLLIAVQDS